MSGLFISSKPRVKRQKVEGKQGHNKSGKTCLSLADAEPQEQAKYINLLRNASKMSVSPNLCESPCQVLQAQDGRLSSEGKKVAFGYQVAALKKFGAEKLKAIPARKAGKTSLVLSHLCGTRNCVNKAHIIIETKRINDERTHCHFCLRNYVLSQGSTMPVGDACKICNHEPTCGSEDKEQ